MNFPSSPTLDQLWPNPALPGIPQWRWDGHRWVDLGGGNGGGFADAPADNITYGRRDNQWTRVANTYVGTVAPPNPQDGDFWFNDTTGFLTLWDGSNWVSTVHKIPGVGAPGGGPVTTPTTGEVGELLTATTAGAGQTIANNAWQQLSPALNIPPGDWQVDERISLNIAGGATALVLYISFEAQGIEWGSWGWQNHPGAIALNYWSATMPLWPVRSATATSFVSRVYVQTSGPATITANYVCRARRMR